MNSEYDSEVKLPSKDSSKKNQKDADYEVVPKLFRPGFRSRMSRLVLFLNIIVRRCAHNAQKDEKSWDPELHDGDRRETGIICQKGHKKRNDSGTATTQKAPYVIGFNAAAAPDLRYRSKNGPLQDLYITYNVNSSLASWSV